jgi:hypothetical protein
MGGQRDLNRCLEEMPTHLKIMCMNKLRIEELEETYPHHKDRCTRNSTFILKEGLNET